MWNENGSILEGLRLSQTGEKLESRQAGRIQTKEVVQTAFAKTKIKKKKKNPIFILTYHKRYV